MNVKSFIETAIHDAKNNNWCMMDGCTTCGAIDFRARIFSDAISCWIDDHVSTDESLSEIAKLTKICKCNFHEFAISNNFSSIKKIIRPIVIEDLKKLKLNIKINAEPLILIKREFNILDFQKELLGTSFAAYFQYQSILREKRIMLANLKQKQNEHERAKKEILKKSRVEFQNNKKMKKDIRRLEIIKLLQNMDDDEKIRFIISDKFDIHIESIIPSEINFSNNIDKIYYKISNDEKEKFINIFNYNKNKLKRSNWIILLKKFMNN